MMRWLAVLLATTLASPTLGADAPTQPTVRLELMDRSIVNGVWSNPPFEFVCAETVIQVEPSRVRTLAFGLAGNDQIELTGMDYVFRGTARLTSVTVAGTAYDRIKVRKLKQTRADGQHFFTGIFIPLLTLTAMEIVLGIDNIIFLAIVAGKLPTAQQPKARRLGLIAALVTRLLLLTTLSFILGLTAPVLTLPDWPLLHSLEAREISWRDIILLLGGAFLIGKSTYEIHDKLEVPVEGERHSTIGGTGRFGLVLLQIAVIDIIFSLDSVITAVGMVESLTIMVIAMVIAVGVMMMFAETIARFVARNPTLKILALAFLILIGVLLVADGLGQHIDKGYVYFAMAFSLVVEVVNIRLRKRTAPVQLNSSELIAGVS